MATGVLCLGASWPANRSRSYTNSDWPMAHPQHLRRRRAIDESPDSGKRRGPPMTGLRNAHWHRTIREVWQSLWVVPLLCTLAALALSIVFLHWDERDPVVLSKAINSSSASSALSALGSGMLAFTGFVTAVVLMVVQFGTSEFSPRFVAWFRRDRTLKYALSTFTATFVFALVSTAQIGRGSSSFVPTRTLIAALCLMLLSILMFLVLIQVTTNGLRVANAVQNLDSEARQVFDAVYPNDGAAAAAATAAVQSLHGQTPLQTVCQGSVGSVLVALDRDDMARVAARYGAVIVLIPAVGDHVSTGAPLLNVYGSNVIPDQRLRRALVFGDERTIDDDPAFAIRMLVDVAIKALSPAVNDPTTAVQSLDRIEDLLRYASVKHLSVGLVVDKDGTNRFVYPTPTWEDLVELALSEIRAFGANQYQIDRRLRALLQSLIAEVPSRRRAALQAQLSLLEDAIVGSIPEGQRAPALVADRQGIGMSRRDSGEDGKDSPLAIKSQA